MVRGLTTAEFGRLLQRQADGRANRVHAGELPSRSIPSRATDDDIEISKKHKRAVTKGANPSRRQGGKDAAETDADEEDDDEREARSDEDGGSHGYTPGPVRAKAGVSSHVLPVSVQDIVGSNALLAISSSATKLGAIARKKKGPVQIASGFTDRSSDRTPTSPAPRRVAPRRRHLLPQPASDAEAPTGRISNNRSNTSALPPAPSAAATHSDSNNIVTKVMSSLLWFQLGACTVLRVHIKDPLSQKCLNRLEPGHHLSNGLLLSPRKRDDSILQQQLQSMSQASDINVVVNISHASPAAPTQMSGNVENKSLTGENKSLRVDLEGANKRAAERECQLAAALEKIKSLETQLVSAEAATKALAPPATESAKQACYTLRLALNDLGAHAADLVVEVAGTYGDCCARVAAGFVLSLLHEHGCNHVEDFPEIVKKDWPENDQFAASAVKAFRKSFWENGGKDGAKTQLRDQLERIARAEDAAAAAASEDPEPSGAPAGREGEGNKSQDHPEVDWRNKNEKFVAVKGLPKTKCPFRPVYREMLINGHSYKVIKVAG
uniref:Uncharacterized protein n=1 Tax=Oryza barthii TaxID=65489 RepID=A0A0D3F4Q2_9ORYZ